MLFFSKKHRDKKNGGKLSKVMGVLLATLCFGGGYLQH